MKSVGEVMAFGRTFQESVQKALRGLETGANGFDERVQELATEESRVEFTQQLRLPGADRLWLVADAFRLGFDLEEINDISGIDPWFLAQIRDIVLEEQAVAAEGLKVLTADTLRRLKRKGFSDARLGKLAKVDDDDDARTPVAAESAAGVQARRHLCGGILDGNRLHVLDLRGECESDPSDREKIMILGGGPNRIGQGIEFDYCCVHAALALRESGFETIMVNCNPETVSTDYDTSDRLYFEPLTYEDVMEIIDREKPRGVIVQFGGQTPLKLARMLEASGAPIIGTDPDSIDLAEDRERFQKLIEDLELSQPPNSTARSKAEALSMASDVGYPLVVRPSYVLGGRAMESCIATRIWRNTWMTRSAFRTRARCCSTASSIWRRKWTWTSFAMASACWSAESWSTSNRLACIQGDSGCSLPPFSLTAEVQEQLIDQCSKLAKGLNVIGLMNTQFAIQNDVVYLLEVNPRASRTVPFVSKATGVPLAKIAARVMVGMSLEQQGFTEHREPPYFSVKESVFPFRKMAGADPILGPEMKSTGEVMGVGRSFGEAYAKAQLASGVVLPRRGTALLSVRERDKDGAVGLAKTLAARGFDIVATHGTAKALAAAGIECRRVNKVREGRPHIVDMIKNGEISLIVNTTEGKQAIYESRSIRAEAVRKNVTYYTSLPAAVATCNAIEHIDDSDVNRLQDLHGEIAA